MINLLNLSKNTPMINLQELFDLNNRFQDASPEELLKYFLKEYKGRIALSSSLGIEDQALTKMVTDIDKEVTIFTLDTGRLFPETYNLIDKTNEHFGIKIKVLFPDAAAVEQMVQEKGVNLFYHSIEDRKLCCEVRKLQPLKKIFRTLDAWACGLRRSQSVTRTSIRPIEWDTDHNIIKINPLFSWDEQQVWDYIKKHHIPYNPLHDQGFPSIGCQPCTRAVAAGEDIRSGRWWWEEPEHKECGLHKKS